MLISNIEVPSNIGEFSIENVVNNEIESPGLGHTITYNEPSNKYHADCYIYNLGMESIPIDINNPIVQDHYNDIKKDLYTALDLGIYQDLKFNDSYGINNDENGHGAWIAEISIIQNDTIHDSYIYLTVFNDQFLKIRFTLESSQGSSDISHEFSINLIKQILKEKSPF
jgi:hypothetical protein